MLALSCVVLSSDTVDIATSSSSSAPLSSADAEPRLLSDPFLLKFVAAEANVCSQWVAVAWGWGGAGAVWGTEELAPESSECPSLWLVAPAGG